MAEAETKHLERDLSTCAAMTDPPKLWYPWRRAYADNPTDVWGAYCCTTCNLIDNGYMWWYDVFADMDNYFDSGTCNVGGFDDCVIVDASTDIDYELTSQFEKIIAAVDPVGTCNKMLGADHVVAGKQTQFQYRVRTSGE